ncbi:SH3 domain-containing protein 21 isoform X2 [Parambassis ranga]|uniref:Osteoclast-stimulating factor 1 n=1 Tax=Parambassis ranga TaxID=210632 RepID=A0A6P7JXG7_9TELE|nr:SH3 domain-containing kinase-binding protein 1-like isoform X2 [Parambassis ranga]
MKHTMEVLVLIDFEGTMADEITVRQGDVVKNVTKASEEGWLQGELGGKRGIFPANFVKEVPFYLTGDSKREPRSIRKTKKVKPARKCEVQFAYSPMNTDELELVAGETIEIIKEIEDGWWMGVKNGKVGAFPSNFVKEIFVPLKDGKYNEGKMRPKLADAVFTKETPRRASVRHQMKNSAECCQALFDYKAKAEDELELKKGEVIVILNKETEDEGWWEGELNGRCGFFPDNFVMVIPPVDGLQSGTTNQPPIRTVSKKLPAKPETPAMEKTGPAKPKEDKPEPKDLRSLPPGKLKLPSINKSGPPPVKDKPNKVLPKTNGDAAATVPSKQPEEKGSDQFDGLDVPTEKLSHPTANRAKPPQRRPPSGLATGAAAAAAPQSATDQTEPEPPLKKVQTDKLPILPKGTESLLPSPAKPEHPPKTPPPLRPTPPKVFADSKPKTHKEEPTMESLQAEIKELRMALELLQTRHEQDMQDVKEELKEERNKRLSLQEEVHSLRMKH